MAKNHLKQYVMPVILVVLIVFLGFGLFKSYQVSKKLREEIADHKHSKAQLDENFKVLKTNFNSVKQENRLLSEENKNVKEESALISKKAEQVEIEVDRTLDRLNNFQDTVQDSIDWFRSNSNIAGLEKYGKIRKELKEKCLNFDNKCYIDLTCMHGVNKNNKLKYGYDDYSTGKKDFLKDLSVILKHEGGDCEDFSLLFKAEYNYLMDECLLNTSRQDVIPVAEGKNLSGTYMYIICGAFDPEGVVENYAGHCLVALAENPINSSSDIYVNLKDSTLVEPQNGKYVADMDDSNIIKIFDNGVPPNTLHYVSLVITDNDLKIFNDYADEIIWEGYEDFMTKADRLKARVKS